MTVRSTNPDYLRRLEPCMDQARDEDKKQRLDDLRFRYELAKAFARGDHIPAGQRFDLKLIG